MAVCLLAEGCGKDLPSRPDYILNQPKRIEADEAVTLPGSTLKIALEKPGRTTYSAGEAFQCKLKLDLGANERLPEIVYVYLRKSGVPVGGPWPARPVSREGGSLNMSIDLKAPHRPGTYEIQGEALDSTVVRGKNGDRTKDRIHTSRTLTEKSRITVTNG